jgi:hypothetical protein
VYRSRLLKRILGQTGMTACSVSLSLSQPGDMSAFSVVQCGLRPCNGDTLSTDFYQLFVVNKISEARGRGGALLKADL